MRYASDGRFAGAAASAQEFSRRYHFRHGFKIQDVSNPACFAWKTTVLTPVVPLLLGLAVGAFGTIASLRSRMDADRARVTALQAQLEAASAAQAQLAELRVQGASLRHDLRGILSPALLSADRLANSQDPAIRKVAEIIIRTVERATARLSEARPAQDAPKSPLA